MGKSKQQQLEEDIEKLREKIVECEGEIEDKIKLKMEVMEYIDVPILREINKADIQQQFSIIQEKANEAFIELTDYFVRYWFGSKKMEIIYKED